MKPRWASGWSKAIVPSGLLVLHNAQRLAPVPLFDELRQRLSTDYVGVGNLFGAYLLTYALSNIPVGILADKINNKSLLMSGVVLSLVASVVFAFAVSYPIAALSRLALGSAGALIYIPTIRYVVTSFPKERRGTIMGLVEVGAGTGMIFSLTLLPLLVNAFDISTAFLSLSAIGVFVLFGTKVGIASALPDAAVSIRKKFFTLGVNGYFWYLLAYFFLAMLSHYSVFGWLPTFLRTDFAHSAVKAGLTSTLVPMTLILGSPLAGILSDRLRARMPVLFAGCVMSIIVFIIFLARPSLQLVIGASLLSGIGMAFTTPILMILIGETFGATGSGLAVSVAAMIGQIASALSGMVFGYTLQTWNNFTAVWIVALISSTGSILCLLKAHSTMVKQKERTVCS